MFKTLAELLILEAEEGITSGVRKLAKDAADGYKDAKSKRKEAEQKAKQAQDEAERKAKAAVKAEDDIKKKAETEAEKAAKAAAADHKVKSAEAIAELHDDIETFVANFFERFPYQGGGGGAEDMLDKYKTREAALAAFKAYRDISTRLEKLREGFNKSLVAAGKVTKEQIGKYESAANKIRRTGEVPSALTKFVRAESVFFKRLMKVNDDFKIDDLDFKSMLSLKIKQTDPARVPDAAQALNMLFAYASDEFAGKAKTIAAAGRAMDDETAAARKTARDAAIAKTAAQDAADISAKQTKE
jgi:hypothetical protein